MKTIYNISLWVFLVLLANLWWACAGEEEILKEMGFNIKLLESISLVLMTLCGLLIGRSIHKTQK